MFNLQQLKEQFKNCECGVEHKLDIRDIQVGSGITSKTGQILRSNGFLANLLLVADKNTLKASNGILDSLDGLKYHPYMRRRLSLRRLMNMIKD